MEGLAHDHILVDKHTAYDPIALLRGFEVAHLDRPAHASDDSDASTVKPLRGDALPAPIRGLLDHPRDMTSTLQTFFGEVPTLRVMAHRRNGTWLERHVQLLGRDSEAVLEVGAIRIFLDRFPFVARVAILEGERPLGGILADEAIAHRSHPQGFFRLDASAHLAAELGFTPRATTLYGRHNELIGDSGLLAEVVEVLPPIDV
ncbi:MAG: hypothetical protein AAGD38_11820 [Acidobacteriota bacterium]